MSDVPLLRNSGIARDRDPQAPPDDLEFEAAIGRNVRQLRLAQGLTVAEMAARVGISKAMLSKIENAQTSCSLSTLALLAKGLDVPVTSLFRGADVERPAAFVKSGTGARIVRNGTKEGHEYQLLSSLRGGFERHGIPGHPSDLQQHRIVAATSASGSVEWRFCKGGKLPVQLRPALFCNSNDAVISAACSGWGLTRVHSYQVEPSLIDGRLQTVLEDFEQALHSQMLA